MLFGIFHFFLRRTVEARCFLKSLRLHFYYVCTFKKELQRTQFTIKILGRSDLLHISSYGRKDKIKCSRVAMHYEARIAACPD
jgi:hypothetical protein